MQGNKIKFSSTLSYFAKKTAVGSLIGMVILPSTLLVSPDLVAHAASKGTQHNPAAYEQVAQAVAESPFKDVATDSYAFDAILWGKEKGLISGYTKDDKPTGKFGLNDPVTEAQFVKMASIYLGLTDTAGNITKNSGSHWSDAYYDAMSKHAVPLNGYFDDVIRNTAMKRGNVAQVLGYLLGDSADLNTSVNFLLKNDITTGQNPQFEDNDLNKFFGATNNLTRGQAITFLYRMDRKNLNNLSSLADMTSNDAISLNAKAKEGYSHVDSLVKIKVVEPTESNGFAKEIHFGNLDIKFTPGQKGHDINEVKEIRKGYVDNVFTADADELGSELVFEDFKKDVNDKNKKIVENLDKSLDYKTADFKTGDYRTFITRKDDTDESILIYNASKAIDGHKSEVTYYDSSIWIDSVYYLESEENALRFHKIITDAGFELTKKELDIGVAKAIKNRGSDFYVIRNYKFIDAVAYDYIKIHKIN